MKKKKLVISLGGPASLSRITREREASWPQLVKFLSREPLATKDKTAAGWFCPAKFSNKERHGNNLAARYALTFDYDDITPEDLEKLKSAYDGYEYLMYTTASHTKKKPRIRIIFPLSRPATADEFRCVTRTIGAIFDLQKLAKESDKPTQMMFLPTKRPRGAFWTKRGEGQWVDVDVILESYDDWKDKTEWPARKNEALYNTDGMPEPPDTKPGVVGDFCRAFRIPEVIDRFELPYERGSSDDRYTYIHGSRPDGLRIYDDGLKAHSDHDTDPANGQQNAFDLVRLHKFVDKEADKQKPITERASYAAMVKLALEQPELQQARVEKEFTNLDDEEDEEDERRVLAQPLERLFANPTRPRWLLRDKLERGVIALMAGPRGSYKSFIALDWTMRVVMEHKEPVYVLSAEGADFDRRAKAWLQTFEPKWPEAKHSGLYVAQMRLDLNQHDNIELVRQDCHKNHKIKPAMFVLDTFSKLSGALDENSNTDVKAFIGRLDNGLKRTFDATVLLITHTGHGEKTRARGASALEADTDAAYIVSRYDESMISITRDRFKSSPELPPLAYKPEIVPLGYKDEDGELVTSVVLRESNRPSRVIGKHDTPKGMYAKHTLQVAQALLRQGPVRLDLLINEAAGSLTPPAGRDTRKQNVSRAVQGLVVSGHLYKHGENSIALTPAVSVDDEDFEDE